MRTARVSLSTTAIAAPTRVLLKDVRKNDRGDSRRLTFEERSERRMGKNRQQRESKEQLQEEAQMMVAEDYPDELESIFAKIAERVNVSAMKVLNMAKCLELIEVEVPGGHKVLLTAVAQVAKVSNTMVEIEPSTPSFASSLLQCVSRFDATLNVSKEGTKIRVALPPVTTARRDKAAHEIEREVGNLRQRVKQARTSAGKVIQEAGLNDGVAQELIAELDKLTSAFLDEKVAELELLSEEVQSMGAEESDVGKEGAPAAAA